MSKWKIKPGNFIISHIKITVEIHYDDGCHANLSVFRNSDYLGTA